MPADGTSVPVPALRLRHATAHRARLQPLDKLSGVEAAQALADRLARLPGIDRVRVRPGTGSVILTTTGDAQRMLQEAAAAGLLRLEEPEAPVKVRPAIDLGFALTDRQVQSRTGEALDLRTLLALLLLVVAGIQVSRGKIAGPATTLVLSALSLLNLPGGARR